MEFEVEFEGCVVKSCGGRDGLILLPRMPRVAAPCPGEALQLYVAPYTDMRGRGSMNTAPLRTNHTRGLIIVSPPPPSFTPLPPCRSRRTRTRKSTPRTSHGCDRFLCISRTRTAAPRSRAKSRRRAYYICGWGEWPARGGRAADSMGDSRRLQWDERGQPLFGGVIASGRDIERVRESTREAVRRCE